MKIRAGFVTNSSSTNFIFMFKGKTREELIELIRKNSKSFDINYYDDYVGRYKCNAEDVINSISDCLNMIDDYNQVRIYDKKELISRVNKDVSYWKESYGKNFYKEAPEDLLKIKYILNNVNLNKIDSVLEIQFGDNHGNIRGTDIGYAMDYKGREIHIVEDNFIVLTEQTR